MITVFPISLEKMDRRNGGLCMRVGYISPIQMQKIEHVYQPMWNVTNVCKFAHEALLRFPEGRFEGNIEAAFTIARTEGTLYELDTRSIAEAIFKFPFEKLAGQLLFVNIYPSTFIHPHFPLFLAQLVASVPGLHGNVVFEVNETKQEEAYWDLPEMKERMALVREYGFAVALDDIGKGAAGLQKIIEYAPDYIKLDRYFADGLSSSTEKQEMISLLLHYAKNKMGVILEGIEKEEDFAAARAIRVPFIQGYFLGFPEKPAALFCQDHSAR